MLRWLADVSDQSWRLLSGRKPPRFLTLTPGCVRNQLLYDRQRRRFLRLTIRDRIDFEVVRQIFQQEDYALHDLARRGDLRAYYDAAIAAGRRPLIVDCGANCGMATRYFNETYPEAFVVAVEPEDGNLQLARKNVVASTAACYLAAVGCADTKATIRDPGQGNWGFRVEASPEGSVEVVSLNTLCARFGTREYAPFIVKIDIEGFEANLFSDNCEWIDLFPLLIIELHDWLLPGQANSRAFLRQIAQRDRDFVFRGENVFSISNALHSN